MKQAPQAWYAKIDSFFINLGFKHHQSNQSIYILHIHGDTLIYVVYADDLVITDNNLDLVSRLKT